MGLYTRVGCGFRPRGGVWVRASFRASGRLTVTKTADPGTGTDSQEVGGVLHPRTATGG